MTEEQIQEIVDRVVAALEGLAPADPGFWGSLPSLTPVVALVVGVLGAIVALITLNQKRRSDARSEWWRRTQWALEATTSNVDEKLYTYGTEMLRALAKSKLAGKEELDLLDAVWEESPTKMSDNEIVELLRESRDYVSPEEQSAMSAYLQDKALSEVGAETSVDDEADSGDNDVKEESR